MTIDLQICSEHAGVDIAYPGNYCPACTQINELTDELEAKANELSGKVDEFAETIDSLEKTINELEEKIDAHTSEA